MQQIGGCSCTAHHLAAQRRALAAPRLLVCISRRWHQLSVSSHGQSVAQMLASSPDLLRATPPPEINVPLADLFRAKAATAR
jgi:hypothetical protein